MATRAPARMSAEARREQLLDVTKAIVAERGFHAVSIEGVAREAGISRPIVYGHFDDLPGLLDALVRREGARALGQLAEVLPPPLERRRPGGAAAWPRSPATSRPCAPTRRRGGSCSSRTRAPRACSTRRSRAAAPPSWRSCRRAGRRRAARRPDPELAAHLLSALERRGGAAAARRPGALPARARPRARALVLRPRWFRPCDLADRRVRRTLIPARRRGKMARRGGVHRAPAAVGGRDRRADGVLRLRDHPRAAAGALSRARRRSAAPWRDVEDAAAPRPRESSRSATPVH